MTAPILVGISAWSEPSLLASGWYPKEARDAEGRLRFYASRFPLVENDAPYYALPAAERTEVWCERTPPGFTMNVKAFALLTQHYTSPKRFPPDLRARLPGDLVDKPRVYPKDLDPLLLAEIAERFRAGLEPLRACGKLGLVLFQYPVWVPIGDATKALIAATRALLPDDRVAVEFRNATWMSEQNRDETLAFLRDHDLTYTCVDEPQGFPSSVPPIAAATSDVALVRMHGRNAARWNRAARSASERFDYRYTKDELREWLPAIGELAARTERVHVILNNCHSDNAVRNAEEMLELLAAEGAKPELAA